MRPFTLNRRALLQVGAVGVGGPLLEHLLRSEAAAGAGGAAEKRNVILVFQPGGPSHIDMWDMKPDAPVEYRGEFDSIETNLPGYRVCEMMPHLAGMCDKLAILRSVYHSASEHSQAVHTMQTGYAPTKGDPANEVPSVGSIIAKELGPRASGVPPYIATKQASRSGYAAYLGVEYNPFETHGYPSSSSFQVRNLRLPAGVDTDRLARRQSMLQRFDDLRRDVEQSRDLQGIDAFRRQAVELVTSPAVQEAFNLNAESEATRERYGRRSDSGQSALLARRLIEAGARFVTVSTTFSRPWDSHTNNFADHRVLIPGYDHLVSALIEDLDQRGLLETTLVVVTGEFGRTPKINTSAGRDHWPNVFTVVLAGGGVKRGMIVGESNAKGEIPKERPIRHQDVWATVYHQLGIDYRKAYMNEAARPVAILNEGEPIHEIL